MNASIHHLPNTDGSVPIPSTKPFVAEIIAEKIRAAIGGGIVIVGDDMHRRFLAAIGRERSVIRIETSACCGGKARLVERVVCSDGSAVVHDNALSSTGWKVRRPLTAEELTFHAAALARMKVTR